MATVKTDDVANWLLVSSQTRLIDSNGAINSILADNVISGFDLLANKLAFLSALDNDTDASNGFNLSAWSSKLDTESINFNLPYQEFISTELADFKQRQSISLDVSHHGLSGLYAALSVPVYNYVQSSAFITQQDNDRLETKRYEYKLNENGQKTREFVQNDEDGDGTVDETTTYEFSYDSSGMVTATSRVEDSNADGVIDSRYETDYGWTESQKPQSRDIREDNDANGEFERVTRLTWAYNEFDARLRETSVTSRVQSGLMETETVIMSFMYDQEQRLVGTVADYDTNTDGTVDSRKRSVFKYDDRGNRTFNSSITDSNNDGDADQIYDVIEEYNDDNKVTLRRFERDFNGDGALDNLQEYRFTYVNGLLTKEDTYRDGNNDGVIDWAWEREYEYDEQGVRTKRIERYDTNRDGTYENVFAVLFEEVIDETGAVFNEEVGLITKTENSRDFDLDGNADRKLTTSYVYDDMFNLERVTINANQGDVTETEVTEYTFEGIPTALKINTARNIIR